MGVRAVRRPMSTEEKHAMMTQTPIPRLITRMAVPGVISMLVTSLYNMADTFFIGRLNNTSATGAISVVYPMMAIIQAIGFFLGHGSGNTMSRSLGRQDVDDAGRTAATGFFGAWIIGILFSVTGLLLLRPLMRILGATETILPYAVDYGRYILIGAPWMLGAIVLNVQMRFQGNAFFSMIGIASGAVINIALDPLFIYGFGLGVSGAALATICSQAISFGLLLGGSFRGGNVRIRLRNFSPDIKHIKPIALGGLPSLCRQGLGSVASILMNVAAKTYGGITPEAIDAAVAAIGIVNRMMQFCASAIIGFGQGFQPVCGFNYGAGKFDRVRAAFIHTGKVLTIYSTALAVAGWIFASPIVGLFVASDPEVSRIGTEVLRYQCLAFPLTGYVVLVNMFLQNIRRTIPATIMAMSRQGIFLIPSLLLGNMLLGFLGVEIAQAVADTASFLLALPLGLHALNHMDAKE